MKTVTWTGEDCIIPKCGEAIKGEQITLLSDKIADSYVKQGLATFKNANRKEGVKDGLRSE